MHERRKKDGCCCDVKAFADCEASAELRMRVLDKLAADKTGELARKIKHQIEMKEAVKHAMSIDERCQCPEDLKGAIGAMLMGEAEGVHGHDEEVRTNEKVAEGVKIAKQAFDGEEERAGVRERLTNGVIGRIGRWLPSGVAAALFITAAILYGGSGHAMNGSGGRLVAGMMPTKLVSLFEQRHVRCSNDIEKLHHDPNLPGQIEELPGVLGERFGGKMAELDLRGIGYQFERVGKCTVPGDVGVHLVYEPIEDETSGAISLWITPEYGRFNIENEKIYTINGNDEAHPILMWKANGIMYYLVGDSMEASARAAGRLMGHYY